MTALCPFPRTFDLARYSLHYLVSCVPEADAQAAMLERLRFMGILAVPVDAGAKALRGRAWGALKRAGVQNPDEALQGKTGAGLAGLADIVGCIPGTGRALFIEMKAPRWLKPGAKAGTWAQKRKEGLPTEAQLAFLDTMHRAGAVVGVAWSSSDLDHILRAAGLAPG